MNFEKYNGTEYFEDFDPAWFLSDKFHKQSSDGEKDYFILNRDSSFMLLKALKFRLSASQKKSIGYLCNYAKSHDGNMPDAPKKPIKINLSTSTIEDGVVRLFLLQYQRTDRVVWVEFVV